MGGVVYGASHSFSGIHPSESHPKLHSAKDKIPLEVLPFGDVQPSINQMFAAAFRGWEPAVKIPTENKAPTAAGGARPRLGRAPRSRGRAPEEQLAAPVISESASGAHRRPARLPAGAGAAGVPQPLRPFVRHAFESRELSELAVNCQSFRG